MIEQRVSTRYAQALLDTALQEGHVDLLLKDFKTIAKAVKDTKELKALTFSPLVRNWIKKKIYIEIFEGKVDKLAMDFLLLLTKKNRDNLIYSIAYQYEKLYDKMNNRLHIEITSAVEMSEESKNKIVSRLTEWSGKTILPKYYTDDTIKGGMLVKIDDWVYDASVKNQLRKLHKRLVEGQAV